MCKCPMAGYNVFWGGAVKDEKKLLGGARVRRALGTGQGAQLQSKVLAFSYPHYWRPAKRLRYQDPVDGAAAHTYAHVGLCLRVRARNQ